MSKYLWNLGADRKNGIVRNVTVMQMGPATGHGFDVTSTTLVTTFRALMHNQYKQGGTPTHYGHDEDGQLVEVFGPDAGHMGGLTSIRLDDDRIIANLHLSDWTRHVNHYATGKSIFDSLMLAAEVNPRLCAMSPVITYTAGDDGKVYVHRVDAVDIVDEGAVTRSLGVVAPPAPRRALMRVSLCTSPIIGGRWDNPASIRAAMQRRDQQPQRVTPPKRSAFQYQQLRQARKELAAIMPRLNRLTVH